MMMCLMKDLLYLVISFAVTLTFTGCALSGNPATPPVSQDPPSVAFTPLQTSASAVAASGTIDIVNPTSTSLPPRHPARTATTTPTPVEIEPPAPTSIPTKQILLMYGSTGGDGGHWYDDYLGRDVPTTVLYTDGQFLRFQRKVENDNWYLQSILTPSQMCWLLSRISQRGFFDVKQDGFNGPENDPIYAFDDTVQFSDGASGFYFLVNGKWHNRVKVYKPYEPYLVAPLKETFRFIRNYGPGHMEPYYPTYLVLWIGQGYREMPEGITSQEWPIQLPSLDSLLNKEREREMLVEGDFAHSLITLFGNRPQSLLFKNGQYQYSVFIRPLLPHETLEYPIAYYPNDDSEFELPFECNLNE